MNISEEESNFHSFHYLNLKVVSKAVRVYFDSVHPPEGLASELANNSATLKTLRSMTKLQFNILYPSPASNVRSEDFDTTLIVCLLRNMSPRESAPVTGWNNLPHPGDTSTGADLARVKWYNNMLAHTSDGNLSQTDFIQYWGDLEGAIGRLGGMKLIQEAQAARDVWNISPPKQFKENTKMILEIVKHLEPNIECTEGQSVTFTCEVNHADVPGKWFINDQELITSKSLSISVDGTLHELKIHNVKLADKGNYSLHFEDKPVSSSSLTVSEANISKKHKEDDVSNTVKLSSFPPHMSVPTIKLYIEGLAANMKSSVGFIRFDDATSTAFINFLTNEASEQFLSMKPIEIEGYQVKRERYFQAALDNANDVLSDIKSLGLETVQGFEEIMKEGSYKCYWNRVYLVGNYNIGKTTLAKVLVGDPVPDVRQSTNGIWLYIGLAGMDIDQKKWIFLQKGSATSTVISTMLMSLSSQKEPIPEIKKPDYAVLPETNREDLAKADGDEVNYTQDTKGSLQDNLYTAISQMENAREMKTSSKDSSHLQETLIENIMEAMSNEKIRELVIEVARDGRYKMKIVPIDIWDFGGQKDYYMTHQLFITSRGIFVLMFNGSQNMHQHMPDLSFLPGHYGQPTIAVYLKHWVNSILTFCRRTKEGFPRILFVATHKDLIAKEEVEMQRQHLIKSIHELFESHKGCNHLEYQELLFVDARDSSDPDIALLRERLIQRAIEHPQWGEDMPTAWVPLELELSQEVENGSNIISRAQLEALNAQNRSFTLTTKQLESFLKIQHSLGKLIYFDDINLRNFIIINPVYMIEILRSIVTNEQFWPRGEAFAKVHLSLRKEGMIEKKTIYDIWEQDEFRHILPFKEFMLDILVHLDIIVLPRTDLEQLQSPFPTISFYLVPCMIINRDNTSYLKTYNNEQSSIVLAYTFVDAVIPPALSYRFLGSFLTMWDLKIYNGTRMLFCDLAVVEIDDKHDVVIQIKEKRVIVSLIHHDGRNRINPMLSSSVQECLTAALYRISEFYSSLSTDRSYHQEFHTTMPFRIEFGVHCQSAICYLRKMPSPMKATWKCKHHGREHDVRYLRYWYAEKKPAERCRNKCSGPGNLEFEQFPSDQHLRRLVAELSINICRELAIHLGIEVHVWEDLEYQFQHGNTDNIKFMALWKWKQRDKTACIGDLIQALEKCNISIHNMCQVFRDIHINCDLSETILDVKPTLHSLKTASDYIGNSSLQLGVELGLDVPQLENIQNQLKNKPLEQTREILTRWRDSYDLTPSARSLIKALYRIDKAACVENINF
ncbi:uncharacterized protein [Mytilus edulis]|uniref:uncharacterized protein n=1 Tax=Mytilus edulis TaxID=6550 RepID=UPI0039F0B9A1